MRQHLNAKKTERLAMNTGLPVVWVHVRGGTNHRRDLCLNDGRVFYLFPDGTIEDPKITWRERIIIAQDSVSDSELSGSADSSSSRASFKS